MIRLSLLFFISLSLAPMLSASGLQRVSSLVRTIIQQHKRPAVVRLFATKEKQPMTEEEKARKEFEESTSPQEKRLYQILTAVVFGGTALCMGHIIHDSLSPHVLES